MSLGVRDAMPSARIMALPIADGGDGLIDCLLYGLGGKRVRVTVKGPLGARRKAVFALLRDGTAVVEMAQASGLALIPKERRDALGATSYGTGQLIAAAADRGARRIVVGLGGSAANDGGAGMAQALGARLLDKHGRELPLGAEALLGLSRIEWGSLKRTMRGVRVLAVSDVANPLLGPRGSAVVFGPQKGASPAQVRILAKALQRYAQRLREDLGRDVAGLPGAGAAGGLGAGLLAFLSARLVPGADWLLKELGAGASLRRADFVLTGEGRLDETSFYGKAPIALARLAKGYGLPVAAVCAVAEVAERDLPARLKTLGISVVVDFAAVGASPRDSMTRARHWARRAAVLAAGCWARSPSLSFRTAAARRSPRRP